MWILGLKTLTASPEQISGVTADGRECVTIPAFLRDQAADYYESLDDDLKHDYCSVCDSLRERFITKELQSFYYSNLFGCRQAETQTVDDFAANITKDCHEKSIADLSAQVSVMATGIGRISSQRQYASNLGDGTSEDPGEEECSPDLTGTLGRRMGGRSATTARG